MKLRVFTSVITIFSFFIFFTSYVGGDNLHFDPQKNLELTGCWKGGILKNNSLLKTNKS